MSNPTIHTTEHSESFRRHTRINDSDYAKHLARASQVNMSSVRATTLAEMMRAILDPESADCRAVVGSGELR